MYNTKEVVIIDTGIDMANRSLLKHVINGTGFNYSRNQIIEEDNFQDDNGHGTSCADTILQVFNEAQFYVIKIADSEGKTSTGLLQKALSKCLALNIKFICVSLALTTELYQQDLSEIIQLLVEQNKLVFVSVKNGSQCSYPASLPTVIGVAGQPYCLNESFSFSVNKEIQGTFDDSPIFVYTLANRFAFFKGTSKANALCVGMSMKILSDTNECNEEMTFSEFNDLLEQYARQHEVAVPDVSTLVKGNCEIEFAEHTSGKVKEVIYKITRKELDISTLMNRPLISQSTGISFNNFYDFWKCVENELGFSIPDYHSIHILNVCSLSALLQFLEGVVSCQKMMIENG